MPQIPAHTNSSGRLLFASSSVACCNVYFPSIRRFSHFLFQIFADITFMSSPTQLLTKHQTACCQKARSTERLFRFCDGCLLEFFLSYCCLFTHSIVCGNNCGPLPVVLQCFSTLNFCLFSFSYRLVCGVLQAF